MPVTVHRAGDWYFQGDPEEKLWAHTGVCECERGRWEVVYLFLLGFANDSENFLSTDFL